MMTITMGRINNSIIAVFVFLFIQLCSCKLLKYEYSVDVKNATDKDVYETTVLFYGSKWTFKFGDIVPNQTKGHYSEQMPEVPSRVILSWRTTKDKEAIHRVEVDVDASTRKAAIGGTLRFTILANDEVQASALPE